MSLVDAEKKKEDEGESELESTEVTSTDEEGEAIESDDDTPVILVEKVTPLLEGKTEFEMEEQPEGTFLTAPGPASGDETTGEWTDATSSDEEKAVQQIITERDVKKTSPKKKRVPSPTPVEPFKNAPQDLEMDEFKDGQRVVMREETRDAPSSFKALSQELNEEIKFLTVKMCSYWSWKMCYAFVPCIVLLVIIGLLIGFIFFVISFRTIRFDEYGIRYSNITLDFVDTSLIWGPGLHLVPFHHNFLIFPRMVQTIDFSDDDEFTPHLRAMDARTLNGVNLDIDVSFQYQFTTPPTNLFPFFRKFGTNYQAFLILVARSVIQDVCSLFTAQQFFTQRSTIAGALHAALDAELQRQTNGTMNVFSFQFRKLVVGTKFNEELLELQLAQEGVHVRQIFQSLYFDQIQITKEVATIVKEQVRIFWEAESQAGKIRAEGVKTAIESVKFVEAQETAYLQSALSLTTTELQTYLYIREIMHEKKKAQLFVNFRSPGIINV